MEHTENWSEEEEEAVSDRVRKNEVQRDRCLRLMEELALRGASLDTQALETRKETQVLFASASTLHRGYLCPSPLRDILVEGEVRGAQSDRCLDDGFRYGLDEQGAVLTCEEYRQGRLFQKEYLVREADAVYGFVYDAQQRLYAMSRELYVHGKLHEYALLICGASEKQCWIEEYSYDDVGLVSSEHCLYEVGLDLVRRWRYLLERENGMLTAYYVTRVGNPFPTDGQGNCIPHQIVVKRKA